MSESIVTHKTRIGSFTSSEIYKLCGSGRAKDQYFSESGLTYIKTRKQERKRKASMSTDADSMATAWGDLMEIAVFDLLTDLSYEQRGNRVVRHPELEYWSGAADLLGDNCIGEIKGYQPEKFCDYADVLLTKDINNLKNFSKKAKGQEYWQLVSNAEINQVDYAEAILYQPYISEAQRIMDLCDEHSLESPYFFNRFHSIIELKDFHKLPFQPDDSEYPNLITFKFKVPGEDKEFLRERVKKAEQKLEEI